MILSDMADTIEEENSCNSDNITNTKEDTDIDSVLKEKESSKNGSEDESQVT